MRRTLRQRPSASCSLRCVFSLARWWSAYPAGRVKFEAAEGCISATLPAAGLLRSADTILPPDMPSFRVLIALFRAPPGLAKTPHGCCF